VEKGVPSHPMNYGHKGSWPTGALRIHVRLRAREGRPAMAQIATWAALDAEVEASPAKRARCGSCTGCRAQDCGACINCLDKRKFGGEGAELSQHAVPSESASCEHLSDDARCSYHTGIKKQACLERRCISHVKPNADLTGVSGKKRVRERGASTPSTTMGGDEVDEEGDFGDAEMSALAASLTGTPSSHSGDPMLAQRPTDVKVPPLGGSFRGRKSPGSKEGSKKSMRASGLPAPSPACSSLLYSPLARPLLHFAAAWGTAPARTPLLLHSTPLLTL
jgi:hypothetical protein